MHRELIDKLVKREQASFAPDEISRISVAYEEAVRLVEHLRLDTGSMEIIARKIVDIARESESDSAQLTAQAIKRLRLLVKK